MLDAADTQTIERVMRALAAATRSLRLYPPSSPIPRESVDAVVEALDEYFSTGAPVLSLFVAREGFEVAGEAIATSVPGTRELANELREHGAAEIDILPEASAEELLALLAIMGRPAEEVRVEGGLAALAAAAGVESVRLSEVQLTVVDTSVPAAEEDIEEFLRELSSDPDRLSAWLGAAAAGDPAALEEGLLELLRVCGPDGENDLVSALSAAFLAQDPEGKDALLGLALDPGPVRGLTGRMFSLLTAPDIAGSVLGGVFGKNMLSLSNALAHLPLEQVTADVRAEIHNMLPGAGHGPREAEFLDHMIDIRSRLEPEPSLVDSDRTYRAVLQAAALKDEDVERARHAVTASGGVVNAAGVRTMLALLDQQQDFQLYCAGADNLAGMVPRLIRQGDLPLAQRVLTELANRQSRNTGPWPELSDRLKQALDVAAGPQSMGALVEAVVANPSLMPAAQEIVRYAGDAAGPALVAEGISHKADGIALAEQLLGRRLIDLLNAAAPEAQWFQLAPIVARLAKEGDARSVATIGSLMRRPDAQSRREVATGLAMAGGPIASQLLTQALKDPSAEVAIVAARAIAKSGEPGSAELLSARISEIDLDGTDYVLGREFIAALARTPGPEADAALAKLASRRALIKRGHFADVQQLVAQAQQLRTRGGGGQ